jgi:hypothetical protein
MYCLANAATSFSKGLVAGCANASPYQQQANQQLKNFFM